MAFDSTCKFLAELFPTDIATWLLGSPIPLTQLDPQELSIEPIRADTLILLESDTQILHAEFQTDPDPDIPFRLTDYRLRLYRRHPTKSVLQVVIYLRPSRSPLVYQNSFELPSTRHGFEIIRIWEQAAETFLESIGLLPFATLGQTEDREQILQQVAQQIEAIPDRRERSNLMASAAVLAGLVLEREVINRILREDIVKESVIYQDWIAQGEARGRAEGKAEGRAEGKAEGRAEGKVEGRAEGKVEGRAEGITLVATNLIRQGLDLSQIAEATGLSLEQLHQMRQDIE